MASNKYQICLMFCASIFFMVVISSINSASITYKGIGTFTTEDFFHPIYRPIVLLPKSPEEIDATFSLFTRNNRTTDRTSDVLAYNATIEQLRSSKFQPKLRTKLIVHGFNENARKWMSEMKDNFLQAQDLNVFLVEWPKGDNPPYAQAAANAKVLGPMIGMFIEHLVQAYRNVSMWDSIHLIGHSLGGHVAGLAGKYLKGRLYRITGLDPAGPYFEGVNHSEARLWHTDAQFVDSIHTDGSQQAIPYSGLGMYETCSHVDIYPNGGRIQPGCVKERLTSVILEGLGEGTRRLLLCSHIRSVDYFIESILAGPAQPRAYQCDDYEQYRQGQCSDCGSDNSKCVLLGPRADLIGSDKTKAQGTRYFMATAKSAKYLRFQYLVTIQMAPMGTNDHRTTSDVRISLKLIHDDRNRSETIEFTEKKQQFEYGRNYSRLFVSDHDPGTVREIEFILKKGGSGVLTGLLSSSKAATIRVDHLEIIALSPKSSETVNKNQQNQNPTKLEPPKKIKFVLDTNTVESVEITSDRKKGAVFKRRTTDNNATTTTTNNNNVERVLDDQNHNY